MIPEPIIVVSSIIVPSASEQRDFATDMI